MADLPLQSPPHSVDANRNPMRVEASRPRKKFGRVGRPGQKMVTEITSLLAVPLEAAVSLKESLAKKKRR